MKPIEFKLGMFGCIILYTFAFLGGIELAIRIVHFLQVQ